MFVSGTLCGLLPPAMRRPKLPLLNSSCRYCWQESNIQTLPSLSRGCAA